MDKHMAPGTRRRGGAAVAALIGGVLVLSACSTDDHPASSGATREATSQAQVDEAAAKKGSDARMSVTPANGSTNASINNSGVVKVTGGTLDEVRVTST